jgi:maltooligosyltrehalose trehalohydrolase
MTAEPRGYFETVADDVGPGARYTYILDGRTERPDPASRFQPEGVHGPSAVVDPGFAWTSGGSRGLPLEECILYELHAGTFTAEGTLDAAIGRLDYLADLGITVVELMPVAQFPGARNWGYDGVYPFAVQNSYGGPQALKRFVDACHSRGLGVALDVVYNHLGPEGNYFSEFAPYFTDRHRTPWGQAINFDGPDSDEVRRFFIGNALRWVTEFRIDALRLDAVHAILDNSPVPFLRELCDAVHARASELRRRVHVIAESDANDVRTVLPAEQHGFGFDAQWSDDFHHALHTVLTGERSGYYEDYGEFHHLAKAFRSGYVYTGEYSTHRRRRHGSSPESVPGCRFVICAQNHDQVGNRMLGERLASLVSFERLKLAAGAVLLAPYLPLLFMAEEYGETAPFQYFVSHSDPALVEAVRSGRKKEFAAFAWQGECPDPQSEQTFLASKLHRNIKGEKQCALLAFYRELIRIRKNVAPFSVCRAGSEVTEPAAGVLCIRRWHGGSHCFTVYNFSPQAVTFRCGVPKGKWRVLVDSASARWAGPGGCAPESVGPGVSLSLPASAFAAYVMK